MSHIPLFIHSQNNVIYTLMFKQNLMAFMP